MSPANRETIQTPDFRSYDMEPAIVDAQLFESWIQLRWADGREARFHLIWLRDNAADAKSIDSHSREKLFDILDIPAQLKPLGVKVDRQGALVVDWGGQCSRYHPGWLRAYCYDLGVSDEREIEHQTWDAGLAAQLPSFDAGAISQDPETRLDWLLAIRRYGIALVDNSPAEADAYIDWLENLLLIRDMNWGKHFDVIYQPDGQYISNKAIDIPPHNDAATRPHMPGIQIFHCVKNTVEGGESYWVDGFHIAELLRRDHPRDFELLTTVPWAMANRNSDSEYFCKQPFISLSRNGKLQALRHTHWLREPLIADFDLIEPLYRAYRRFVEIANDPQNRIQHRLQARQVSFIDNPRVFHARGPYLTGQGQRHMQVSHSEREEIDSAIAVLRRNRSVGDRLKSSQV